VGIPLHAAGEVLGIDVSHHSGQIDWAAVAEHQYAFIYVKATEGVDAADPLFEAHWSELARRGIPRGAYHFYVTEDDPVEQAEFFLSRVEHRHGDLAPVVDLEVIGHSTTGDLAPRVLRFLEIVEERVGITPIIYTNARFWDAHLGPDFGRFPLWIAEYGVEAPVLPQGWSEWLFWQFQGDATVPGIEKGADRSKVRPGVDLGAHRIAAPPATSASTLP
jgi:lysozyme